MIVRELIEALKAFDPNDLVVVDGYHGGYKTCESAKSIRLILNATTSPYYDTHELPRKGQKADCRAVYLRGPE